MFFNGENYYVFNQISFNLIFFDVGTEMSHVSYLDSVSLSLKS